eukprot:gene4237-8430_t
MAMNLLSAYWAYCIQLPDLVLLDVTVNVNDYRQSTKVYFMPYVDSLPHSFRKSTSLSNIFFQTGWDCRAKPIMHGHLHMTINPALSEVSMKSSLKLHYAFATKGELPMTRVKVSCLPLKLTVNPVATPIVAGVSSVVTFFNSGSIRDSGNEESLKHAKEYHYQTSLETSEETPLPQDKN